MYSILLSLSICVVADPGSTVPGHAHDGPLPDEKALDLEDFGAQEDLVTNGKAKRKPLLRIPHFFNHRPVTCLQFFIHNRDEQARATKVTQHVF